MTYIAGVDVGGTNIVCGILDESGNVISKCKIPTESEKGHKPVLSNIAETLSKAAGNARIHFDEITTIGLGIPGLIYPGQGICKKSVNLNWENVDVASQLNALTGKSIYIDNDVRMYVYGEAIAGAGRGYHHVFGVTIGTGFGAAFINQGEILLGNRSMAGEIGHVPLKDRGFDCKCGQVGCLETIVSATGIVRQAKQKLAAGMPSILSETVLRNHFTSADVAKACEQGDALAKEVMAETGEALAYALSWIVPTLSPDAIIIGGGGALAGDLILEPMKAELDQRLLKDYVGSFVVKTAELNDDAGLIGSALSAMYRYNQSR